jgi:hypothetical protein
VAKSRKKKRRRLKKQGGDMVYAWASWGAAVMRPYTILLVRIDLGWVAAEILRFAQDDNAFLEHLS